VAVCDILGNPKSYWVDGTAAIDNIIDAEEVNRLFNEKYGPLKVLTDLLDKISNKKRVVLAIRT